MYAQNEVAEQTWNPQLHGFSLVEFSRERLVSSLGRRGQHDMQCGQSWAWWLEVQELDFQGAEGGECRDSACPLFLVSGKEKGGRWQEKMAVPWRPQPSAFGPGPLIVWLIYLLKEMIQNTEKTEHGIRYKLPHITHWLLKVTLKRHYFLVLSYWLFLLWVLSVTRILFSHWPLDNLIQVCAHLFQEQRPPAMCFSISLNSGSIISSSSCSLPFPSPSLSSSFLTTLRSGCIPYTAASSAVIPFWNSEEGNKREHGFLKCSACSWDYKSSNQHAEGRKGNEFARTSSP